MLQCKKIKGDVSMKKILCSICIITLLLTSIIPVSASISCEQVHYPMYFNGKLVPEGDKPILSLNWNTYVPLRKVCEGTGLEVVWNNEKQEIYVENITALAAQDYANLAAIYKNTSMNGLCEIIFLNAFYDALDHLTAGEYTLYQTCLDVMNSYEKLIDANITTSKNHIKSLNGYYDGTTVTKATYDNIELCLKEDYILSLSCNGLGVAITKYERKEITYYELLQELSTFNENIEYAKSLVSIPSATASTIAIDAQRYDTFYLYSEFDSKKIELTN